MSVVRALSIAVVIAVATAGYSTTAEVSGPEAPFGAGVTPESTGQLQEQRTLPGGDVLEIYRSADSCRFNGSVLVALGEEGDAPQAIGFPRIELVRRGFIVASVARIAEGTTPGVSAHRVEQLVRVVRRQFNPDMVIGFGRWQAVAELVRDMGVAPTPVGLDGLHVLVEHRGDVAPLPPTSTPLMYLSDAEARMMLGLIAGLPRGTPLSRLWEFGLM